MTPEKLLKTAMKFDMLPDTGLILAGVSGGADSMCLLNALLELSRSCSFTVAAAHFNHLLRGAESDRDESFVRSYCEKHGVAVHCGRGNVNAYAKERKLGLEEAARDMRYAFFRETAKKLGAVRIATAHTADDNAETVLMCLTRGAGTHGLSGIAPVRGMLIRPLLGASRSDVIAYLSARNIPYAEDSTNSLDICTRNRIRHKVIPVLKAINPQLPDAVTALTNLLRADDECLSEIAESFIAEHLNGGAVPVSALNHLHEAVASRVVRKLCGEAASLSLAHVKAVLDLCVSGKPSGSVSLPGITVFKEYDKLVFGGQNCPAAFNPISPEDGLSIIIPGLMLKMSCALMVCDDTINKSLTTFLFKYADLCGKITVRPRREGDFIRLLGHSSTKTLKKLFIERRIPARKRPLVPVIADDKGVLAVYGVGRSDRAVPARGDMAFSIFFEDGSGL